MKLWLSPKNASPNQKRISVLSLDEVVENKSPLVMLESPNFKKK